jgi:uncharacterized protein (DUF488 family)
MHDVSAMWSIGHSTRSAEELVAALRAHGIDLLVDVRRFPASRRLPQFESAALEAALAAAGIAYCWLPSLGGRRKPDPESVNAGWRLPQFRGYADHMQNEEFAEGLFELLMLAGGLRTAMMCSEVLWWRCHRRLVADLLTSLGVAVTHIYDATKSEPHRIAPPARLIDGRLSYAVDEAAGAEA